MHSEPADLVAWLGPAAGPDAYEIGEAVFEAFVSRDPRAQAAFAATRPGHWHVDLYALARLRLVDAGVGARSEEHTSVLQSLMRIPYAVFCLKQKTQNPHIIRYRLAL